MAEADNTNQSSNNSDVEHDPPVVRPSLPRPIYDPSSHASDALSRVKCFLCFETDVARQYKCEGPKWKREGVSEILETIFGVAVGSSMVVLAQQFPLGMCRHCLTKSKKTFDFIESAKQHTNILKEELKNRPVQNVCKKKCKKRKGCRIVEGSAELEKGKTCTSDEDNQTVCRKPPDSAEMDHSYFSAEEYKRNRHNVSTQTSLQDLQSMINILPLPSSVSKETSVSEPSASSPVPQTVPKEGEITLNNLDVQEMDTSITMDNDFTVDSDRENTAAKNLLAVDSSSVNIIDLEDNDMDLELHIDSFGKTQLKTVYKSAGNNYKTSLQRKPIPDLCDCCRIQIENTSKILGAESENAASDNDPD